MPAGGSAVPDLASTRAAAVPDLAPTPAAAAVPAPDPTEGSKRIGPGLAADAAGTPGSSRSMAAALQPPGYGLDPAPGPGPGAGPAVGVPGDPRLGRRVALAGGALVLAVLVIGGVALWLTRPAYLDTGQVARTVGDQLTARLGGPVTVSCPGDQRRRSGVRFSCTASDPTGTRRAVDVTVVDNSGKYTWALRTA
jgi:hypothetical protein